MTTTCSFSQLTVPEGCRRWKHYKGIPESGKTTPITSQEKTVIHVSYMQIKSLTIIKIPPLTNSSLTVNIQFLDLQSVAKVLACSSYFSTFYYKYYSSPPLPQNYVAYPLQLVPDLLQHCLGGGGGGLPFFSFRRNINISFQNSK